MDEKYKNNERKEVAPEMVNVERKAYCSVCGAEMSVYDADIQRADGREPVCKNCLEKALKSK
jgi:formylmethanofuran dehydrogenase subunit E